MTPFCLKAVAVLAAASPGDAWAVGASAGPGGSYDQPLVLHWNGTRWRSVTVPGLSGFYLSAVAASSASDVWVFAASADGGSPKAVRWNGSHWATIALPAGSYYPDEAVVLSPTDAWVADPQQPCTGTGATEVCPTTGTGAPGSRRQPCRSGTATTRPTSPRVGRRTCGSVAGPPAGPVSQVASCTGTAAAGRSSTPPMICSRRARWSPTVPAGRGPSLATA